MKDKLTLSKVLFLFFGTGTVLSLLALPAFTFYSWTGTTALKDAAAGWFFILGVLALLLIAQSRRFNDKESEWQQSRFGLSGLIVFLRMLAILNFGIGLFHIVGYALENSEDRELWYELATRNEPALLSLVMGFFLMRCRWWIDEDGESPRECFSLFLFTFKRRVASVEEGMRGPRLYVTLALAFLTFLPPVALYQLLDQGSHSRDRGRNYGELWEVERPLRKALPSELSKEDYETMRELALAYTDLVAECEKEDLSQAANRSNLELALLGQARTLIWLGKKKDGVVVLARHRKLAPQRWEESRTTRSNSPFPIVTFLLAYDGVGKSEEALDIMEKYFHDRQYLEWSDVEEIYLRALLRMKAGQWRAAASDVKRFENIYDETFQGRRLKREDDREAAIWLKNLKRKLSARDRDVEQLLNNMRMSTRF